MYINLHKHACTARKCSRTASTLVAADLNGYFFCAAHAAQIGQLPRWERDGLNFIAISSVPCPRKCGEQR
jgi:hypothetical protein